MLENVSGLIQKTKFRSITLVLGIIAAILLTFVTDPDTAMLLKIPMGSSTILLIKSLAYYALAVGVIHWGCKAMFDYLDRSEIIRKAIEDKQAGHIFIGLALFVLAYAWVFTALIRTYQ